MSGGARRAPAVRSDRVMAGKALITGGAGFIGGHLCERLLDDGWEVWALDDLSTGSLANVEHLRDRPSVPPGRRQRPPGHGRERARLQVRRRLPPRRGRRRPPDRRAAGADARHEPPGHRDRARALPPLRETGPRRLDLGGVRRPSRGDAARGDRPPHLRADDAAALGVRRLEGDGRVPRARALLRARARLHDRAALQHGRAAPERPVRDGDPDASCSARSRAAARDPRRRRPDALLLPRAGHDPGPAGPDGRRRLGRDLQRRRDEPHLDLGARRAGDRADGIVVRRSSTCRTRRSTSTGSRTCCTGSRRPTRSSAAIGWQAERSLEDILADVVAFERARDAERAKRQRSAGNSTTSRIVSRPLSSITNRSIPKPSPPVGGMP